jgi:nucleotide-binding universal stress UspA family protein
MYSSSTPTVNGSEQPNRGSATLDSTAESSPEPLPAASAPSPICAAAFHRSPHLPGSAGFARGGDDTYTRLLVAYDGSDPAGRALERAGDLAGLAQVTVLTVFPASFTSLGPVPPPREDVEKARRRLEDATRSLRDRGVNARGEETLGDPAKEILDEAARREIDLIVVGSHGKRLAERVLVGSVSAKVVAHAHCDVLVVR